jgi:hypothetical protein
MKQAVIATVASAAVAGLLSTTIPVSAAFAVALVGLAGSGFLGRRKTKQAIDIDD